jgi:GT2 family glycosyltransferase
VSIVVPVYGDPAELDGCLQALRQGNNTRRWEVIAVMNDASEQSKKVLAKHQQHDSQIRAVWPGENVQFALDCNLGFAASSGEQVILLNNDCRVTLGWMEGLLDPLKDGAVAAVQPRMLKPGGTVQCLGVVFSHGQPLGQPLHAGLDSDIAFSRKEYRLQAVTGACLAMRSADFAAVEGLDARFINSQEDVDLCLRLLQLPERQFCMSTDGATLVHSESLAPGRFRHTQWSRMRFNQRWRGKIESDMEKICNSDEGADASQSFIQVIK